MNADDTDSCAGTCDATGFGPCPSVLDLDHNNGVSDIVSTVVIAAAALGAAALGVRRRPHEMAAFGLAAILFLSFATLSPLLLDITRLARGYGLAFLAMSVMMVAALEAERNGHTTALVMFWVAGVLGTWTLPHFAVAFFVTGAVLLLRPDLRSRCLAGGVLSLAAVAVWYAPHVDDIVNSSSQEYGTPIRSQWLISAPFDQILSPAFTDLDELLVERNAEMGGDGAHLPGVGRWRESVELHGDLLPLFVAQSSGSTRSSRTIDPSQPC